MDRRRFIKQSLAVSASGLVLPSYLTSCAKDPLPDTSNFDGHVLIVGAGAAGLYAAYMLQNLGVSCEILEASGEIGGRLRKLEGFADFTIDLGAEWLHGGYNIAADLARSSNIPFTEDTSDNRYWWENSFRESLPEPYNNLLDMDQIFFADSAPDVSLRDHLREQGVGPEGDDTMEFLAADFGTSADRLSVGGTVTDLADWSGGNLDYRFPASYFDLLNDTVIDAVRDLITVNTPVEQIDYSGDRIRVTDAQGVQRLADRVIVAVPISILNAADISFNPRLPTSKLNAFAGLGMDSGMKIFLKFSERFYDFGVTGAGKVASYSDNGFGKNGSDPVLMAFVMGEKAEALSVMTEEEVVQELLAELDSYYDNQASASFVDAYVQDWSKEPFIRGAYSYNRVGFDGLETREAASLPVDNKLFFAGEAFNNNGHFQTVHGAMETGSREVIRILNNSVI